MTLVEEASRPMPARQEDHRSDLLLASALTILTILSRIPYRARMLYNWDAVQFALALQEYDVAKHQPHPPGYALYVVLGRLLNGLLGDPNLSYVVLAILASGATTFVVYFLARALYDRLVAVTAATFLAVSPLFWFYGSVALTYAGEALFASLVAYLAYQTLRGSERHLYLSAAYLGLAAGMRQSLFLLLFPLWLGSAVARIRQPRKLLLAIGVLTLAVLSWFLPMVWLTGGLSVYLRASEGLVASVIRPTSIFGDGSVQVALTQFRHLLESTAVGLGPLLLGILGFSVYQRRSGVGRPEWFLLGWILPPVAFYTLVHFGQAGYVLTFLPALVIFLSRLLVTLLQAGAARLARPPWRWALVGGVLGLLLFANTAFFVSAKPFPREFDTAGSGALKGSWMKTELHDWLWSRTAAALREHDSVLSTYVSAIRGLYDPEETVLITELGNPRSYPWLRHAMFYLPQFPIYQLQVGDRPKGFYAPQSAATMLLTPGTRIALPFRVKRLVWFVDYFNPGNPRPQGLQELELPHGRWLYVLPLGRRPVEYAGYTFVRDPAPQREARRATAR
jgi:hypothetical protein